MGLTRLRLGLFHTVPSPSWLTASTEKSGTHRRQRQMESIQELQNEKQRQMNALILRFGNGQQMQGNCVEAFGASGSDPFFDILV